MLQRVLLLDELGEKFGEVHEYYNLRTPNDAIKLLGINNPEFLKELITSGERGIGYRVMQGGVDFELKDMLLPFGKNDLAIVPVVMGSGVLDRFLGGVALVGLAVATGGVSLGAAGFAVTGSASIGGMAISSSVATALAIGGNVGIALTLGGVAQMLSPQPLGPMEMLNPSSFLNGAGAQSVNRGANGQESYYYRGAINSVGAGATVPVVFGTALIGSHVLSADLDISNDDSDPLKGWIKAPGPSTIRVNGEPISFGEFVEAGGVRSKRLPANRSSSGSMDYPGWYYAGDTHSDRITCRLNGVIPINLNDPSRVEDGMGPTRTSHSLRGEGSGRQDSKRFQIGFRLKNGLFQKVAGNSSTKIDGFITLKVIIRVISSSYSNADVGSAIITVQGLLNDTQDYAWVSWFPFGKIKDKDSYKMAIQVVDYNLTKPASKTWSDMIEIIQYGHLWAGWNPFTGEGLPESGHPNI